MDTCVLLPSDVWELAENPQQSCLGDAIEIQLTLSLSELIN